MMLFGLLEAVSTKGFIVDIGLFDGTASACKMIPPVITMLGFS